MCKIQMVERYGVLRAGQNPAPATLSLTVAAMGQGAGKVTAINLPAGTATYTCTCTVNGKSVAVPDRAEISVVDHGTGQAFTIDLPAGIDASRVDKFASVRRVSSKAVAMPDAAERILVADPATGQASAIDLPAGVDANMAGTVNSKAVAAVAVPCYVRRFWWRTLQLARLRPWTPGIDASRGLKLWSVCNVNGKAVAVLYNVEKILVVDRAAGQASAIDLPAGIDASRLGKFSSVCNVNGKAVAVPCNAEKGLVVDPAIGQASAIDLPAGIDGSRGGKFLSVCT
eukprot:s634_g7.t2